MWDDDAIHEGSLLELYWERYYWKGIAFLPAFYIATSRFLKSSLSNLNLKVFQNYYF